MSYILGYQCETAAGFGNQALMNALYSGSSDPKNLDTSTWTHAPQRTIPAFIIEDQYLGSQKNRLASKLVATWNETLKDLESSIVSDMKNARIGVVLASTKGSIEDVVWNKDAPTPSESDLIKPILDCVLAETGLKAKKTLVVSEACSSSHVAMYIADHWLKHDELDYVVVFACDSIGPFITNGFSALKALAEHRLQPFSQDRDGLLLGEAVATLLLAQKAPNHTTPKIISIETRSEGFAATRADAEGSSLKECIESFSDSSQPDLIIAHGTGTRTNDLIEDRVYSEVFDGKIPITATKWAVGHTMAVSGMIDVIAACEVLKQQCPFKLPGTNAETDPMMFANYLRQSSAEAGSPIKKILLSSLGFGGVQAATLLGYETNKSENKTPVLDGSEVAIRAYGKVIADSKPIPLCFDKKIDRWNQLDEAARCLVILAADLQEKAVKNPDLIILASSEGSLHTDLAFARSGAISPSKFIHTLPNVRGSSLLQALSWRGPVLCIQQSNSTLQKALELAKDFVSSKRQTVHVYSYASAGYLKIEFPGAVFFELKPGISQQSIVSFEQQNDFDIYHQSIM